MPLLFIRYFWLFGPICWMWTLFLIATEVCVCYISSFHVELAQKAARHLPSLSRWDFFPLSSAFSSSLPPTDTSIAQPSYQGLARSNCGVTVCTNQADLSILGKDYALHTVFYDLQCSSLQGHSAQGLSGPFRGLQTPFSILQSPLQANQERLHSIQSSLAQQLSFFTICFYISSLLSAWTEREGGTVLRSVL